jgi:hypothetical protein
MKLMSSFPPKNLTYPFEALKLSLAIPKPNIAAQ